MLLGITMLKANENAVSFSIPTDLQLEGISQPVDKIIETSQTAYPMTRTKNFSEEGMLTTVIQRSEYNESVVVKDIYEPYRGSTRTVKEFAGQNDQFVDDLIMADILSDGDFGTVLRQDWSDPLTTTTTYDGGEVMTSYNADFTVSALELTFGAQKMRTKMIYLQNESELEELTSDDEAIYVIILERDEYGNWLEQVSITPNAFDPTIKNRNISTREIFYRE